MICRKPSCRNLVRSGSFLTGLLLLLALFAGCWPGGQTRQKKLGLIARWEDRRLAPADSLTAMLADGDAHVRLAAVRAAGLIGRNDVLPQLLDLLNDDPSLTVRSQAAFSLGVLGDPRAVPALEQAAGAAHTGLQLAALNGLAQVQNEGAALLNAATGGAADLAAVAWNGLRNQSARVDRQLLLAAIQSGLTRPEADVQWRVLRCAELAPDSTLTGVIVPFAQATEAQVRVHAYRALQRLDSERALLAVVDGFGSHDRFKGRRHDRVTIAGCRALGALAHHQLAVPTDDAAETASPHLAETIAALLIGAVGADDPGVAATALTAMTRATTDLALPPEAAEQESLLPVWRIRLARTARSFLDSEHIAVRAAALRAVAAVRGPGCAVELAHAVNAEEDPQVIAAGLQAVSRHHPDPVLLLSRYLDTSGQTRFNEPEKRRGYLSLTMGAALEGLAYVEKERQVVLPEGWPDDYVEQQLIFAAGSVDFVIAATAAPLLAAYPTPAALTALDNAWDSAVGPDRFERQRAILAGLQNMLDHETIPEPTSIFPDSLLGRTADLLRRGFDVTDIRVRTESRDAALATELLPASLIPSEASLLATLPAFERCPEQAPLTLPGQAPRVRCETERGEFIIELDGELAPNTCATFLALVRQGFYDEMTFHRVVPDFVVQGGCPRGDGWGGPGYTIRSEWSATPYVRGMVGIAHDGKDTGGSQFFVTLSEQPHLVGRYTIFGKVSKGMDVLDGMEQGDWFRLVVQQD